MPFAQTSRLTSKGAKTMMEAAIAKAFGAGADFVMLGRGFHYALAALGPEGPAHLIDILAKDLAANMGQLGATTLRALPPAFSLDAASEIGSFCTAER